MLGWKTLHLRPAMNRSGNWRTPVAGDGAGFPDLLLARDRIVCAELKSERGRVRVEQAEWLRALKRAGAEVHLWRPEHWVDGTIEAVLRQGV